ADLPLVSGVQEGISEVLFTMGSIMLEADATQDAAIYLRLSLYLKPDFSVSALTLGDAYSELSQFAASNDAYNSIQPNNRLYTLAQMHIALNKDRMGKTGEALAMLDRMEQQAPTHYEIPMTKGDLLRLHMRFGEAAEAYGQAIQAIPELKSHHW